MTRDDPYLGQADINAQFLRIAHDDGTLETTRELQGIIVSVPSDIHGAVDWQLCARQLADRLARERYALQELRKLWSSTLRVLATDIETSK